MTFFPLDFGTCGCGKPAIYQIGIKGNKPTFSCNKYIRCAPVVEKEPTPKCKFCTDSKDITKVILLDDEGFEYSLTICQPCKDYLFNVGVPVDN